MKRKIAAILVCCLAFGMTACGGAKGGNADNDSKVYAVEAGSAGEAARKGERFQIQFRIFTGRCPDGSCFRYIGCSNH